MGDKGVEHIGITVEDLDVSRVAYLKVLTPLGYKVEKDFTPGHPTIGLGTGSEILSDFWLTQRPQVTTGIHLAFRAGSEEAVKEFHKAALEAGFTDNGAPGLRPHYGEGYYAAFALDAAGNNIEAVFRK